MLRALVALAALAIPSWMHAQTASERAIVRADSIYFAGDPAGAARVLAAVDTPPYTEPVRWRIFRSSVALGLMAPSAEERNRILDRVLPYASATTGRTAAADMLYWTGTLEGLRSLQAGPRQAIDLATRARRRALQVLALDPQHGGAHHLLGRIEYEFLTLPTTQRLLARLLMGRDYPSDATFESSAAHYRRAAELWPQLLQIHLDAARLELRRGRMPAAARAVERALATPSLHPQDSVLRESARSMLRWMGAAKTPSD